MGQQGFVHKIDKFLKSLLKFKEYIDNKSKHWYIKDSVVGEYYLKTSVSPKQIKYLKIQDIDDYLNSSGIEKGKSKKLVWNPLEKFQEEKNKF